MRESVPEQSIYKAWSHMVSRHSVIDSADDDRRERKYLFTIIALETCSIRETSDAYNQRYKNTFDRIRQQSVSLTGID